MWDKNLKLDFQNKNSNQAKSHLKQIDFSLWWGYWMLMTSQWALEKAVLLSGSSKTPSFFIGPGIEHIGICIKIML